MKKRDLVLEANQAVTTMADFIKSYNKSIPESFPHASKAVLKKFQAVHARLFKHPDQWSIELHRKKLMDWLF